MVAQTPFGSQYLLHECIGIGGTGRVFRASERGGGPDVAVKLLREDLAGQRGLMARLVREAELLRDIDHPNVVRVLDLVAEGNQVGIVMDLVPGGDLRQALPPPLPPAQSMRILAQIADGLQAVHSAGLVHRDLKPENVLMPSLRDGGQGYLPRITDFGLSRLADSVMTTTSLGTPAYVAPEVVEGKQPTSASDVYALGVMAFEWLTGERPFVAENGWALMRAHREDPVPVLVGAPPALQALLQQLLAKDPAARPSAQMASQQLLATVPQVGAEQPFSIERVGPESAAETPSPIEPPAPHVMPVAPVLTGIDALTGIVAAGEVAHQGRQRRSQVLLGTAILVAAAGVVATQTGVFAGSGASGSAAVTPAPVTTTARALPASSAGIITTGAIPPASATPTAPQAASAASVSSAQPRAIASADVEPSTPSREPVVTPPAAPLTPPARAANVTVSGITPTTMRVSWSAAPRATSYTIFWLQRDSNRKGTVHVPGGSLSATLSGLLPQSSYTVIVNGENSAGDGPTNSAVARTLAPRVAKVTFSVKPGGAAGTILVTWNPLPFTNLYTLSLSDAQRNVVGHRYEPGQTSATITDLVPGATYTVTMYGGNNTGNGAPASQQITIP